ncbi:MAG: hypothetical protein RLZZ11_867, partial [Cyanobacteriota bacterium]
MVEARYPSEPGKHIFSGSGQAKRVTVNQEGIAGG